MEKPKPFIHSYRKRIDPGGYYPVAYQERTKIGRIDAPDYLWIVTWFAILGALIVVTFVVSLIVGNFIFMLIPVGYMALTIALFTLWGISVGVMALVRAWAHELDKGL